MIERFYKSGWYLKPAQPEMHESIAKYVAENILNG